MLISKLKRYVYMARYVVLTKLRYSYSTDVHCVVPQSCIEAACRHDYDHRLDRVSMIIIMIMHSVNSRWHTAGAATDFRRAAQCRGYEERSGEGEKLHNYYYLAAVSLIVGNKNYYILGADALRL